MTNEEIREKIASLESDKEELLDHLDKINYLESKRQLKKAELKEEADIRKEIQEIDKKLLSLKDQLLNNKKESTFGQRLALSLGVICLCGVIGVFIGKTAKKNCAPVQSNSNVKSISITAAPEVTPKNATVNATVVPVTLAPTAVPTLEPTAVPTLEPTAVPTPEPTAEPVLVDVTNDEDVARAANKVYEENVMPVLSENPSLSRFASPEVIEDVIRMVGRELPKNSKYNDYTISQTANIMNEVFANQGNGNVLYPVRYSNLFPEGSLEAEYIKSYEDIYDQIDAYRAEGNGDGVIEQTGHLGTKIWNEWALAGLYGDWNPYLFPAEEHYFLLQMAVAPYSNHVDEWFQANDLVACFKSCRKVNEKGEVMFGENGEPLYEQTAVKDLIEALYMGTSTNGRFSIMRDNKVINVFAETFADARNYFDSKANVKVKGLN